jgi:hypothetical protein
MVARHWLTVTLASASLLIAGSTVSAQVLIESYLGPSDSAIRKELEQAAAPGVTAQARLDAIRNLLPHSQPNRYAEMLKAQRGLVPELLALESQRLDKMLVNAPGTTGTSLVSKGAAPSVLSAAVEYGSVFQETTGTTTTLRGNLLGVGRLLFGTEQFPQCPIDAGCGRLATTLRAVSGTVAFEPVKAQGGTAPVKVGDTITTAQLLSDDYHVTSWGARLDLSPKENLQAPEYIAAWESALATLAKSPAVVQLSGAAMGVVQKLIALPTYKQWLQETETELVQATGIAELRETLGRRLTALEGLRDTAGLNLSAESVGLIRATAQLNDVRNALLQAMHANRFSLEFTNNRPIDQPASSNVRAVYSHQPTKAPVVMTLNVAASWYDKKPTDSSQFRDVQAAGQLDRKLGDVASLGKGVLTFAGYYRWLKDDAVIKLGAGNFAPNTTITLPDDAAAVLGTKGHLGVLQARFALSMNNVVKVPFSMTWATRKELIKEEKSVLRGQVGLSLDLDQLFR